MPDVLADRSLARRIEAACAFDLQAFVESSRDSGIYPDAECARVGGGVAIWCSPGNVLNGSYGLGMEREVEREEIEALIRFFSERGEPPRTDVCPYTHRTALRWLAERGFVAVGFEMVLYQSLPADVRPPAAGAEVHIARSGEERASWAELEVRGFTDEQPTPEHRELSRAVSMRTDVLHFVGLLDGEPAGTGVLAMAGGTALLNSDSTLPGSRNRGVQTALIAARVRHASDARCDLAVIEAEPGGTSLRNQQRSGFRVAYNRVTLELPTAQYLRGECSGG